MVLVKPLHVRQAKMCMRGARRFFLRHQLNWSKFISSGVSVEDIEKTNDPMALRVAKIAREQH